MTDRRRWAWGGLALALIASATCKLNPEETPGTLATIQVTDDFFSPSSRLVGIGDSVRWYWAGTNAHDVEFEDGLGNSGVRQGVGNEHFRVFSLIGDYRFRCTQHSTSFTSGQVGVIQVR